MSDNEDAFENSDEGVIDSNEDAVESNEEANDMETDDEDEDDDEMNGWKIIFDKAYDELSDDETPDTMDDLLEEPFFTKFLKKFHKCAVQDLKAFAAVIESDLVHKINSTKKRLLKSDDEDYTDDEAATAAWKCRKHAVRKFIEENFDKLRENYDDSNGEGDTENSEAI